MDIWEKVCAFLRRRQVESYLVGGSVRDRLLGRDLTADVDLAVVGNAGALARSFADAEGGAFYLMDAEHDVARAVFGSQHVDFARLRGDLRSDLGTRDFTINAMARRISDERGNAVDEPVVDPFSGLADLDARRIRAVSDRVFRDDPVRLLRATRIAGELGLEIEPQTAATIRRDAALIANASMERARDELFKILVLPGAAALIRNLDGLGIAGSLLPEVAALKEQLQSEPHAYNAYEHTVCTLQELVNIQERQYTEFADRGLVADLHAHQAQIVSADRARGTLLRLTAILHDIGKPATRSTEGAKVHFYGHGAQGAQLAEQVFRRLRLSNDEFKIAARTIEHHLRPAELARGGAVTNRAIYRFFRDTGDAGVDVTILALADWRAKYAAARDDPRDAQLRAVAVTLLDRYFRAPEVVVHPPLLVDGRTLMRTLAVGPGPQVGQLLEAIREAQAAGQITTAQQALDWAKRVAGGAADDVEER